MVARRVLFSLTVVGSAILLSSCAPSPAPAPEEPWSSFVGVCMDGLLSPGWSGSQPLDIRYTGPQNHEGNLEVFASTDGSCGGPPVNLATVVRAATTAEADQLCSSIDEALGVYQRAQDLTPGGWPAAPADAYLCI